MKKDELYDDLMELYESKNDALSIKSINLNEALFSKYKVYIIYDDEIIICTHSYLSINIQYLYIYIYVFKQNTTKF